MMTTQHKEKVRFFALAGIILAAAFARVIPHPPNFAPIAAIALFGGAYFERKTLAFFVPLAAMYLSDLVLGLHIHLISVYVSFLAIVGIGLWLSSRRRPAMIVGASLASSLVFFLLTNFSEWALRTPNLYPRTMAGLMQCYAMAIPFFRTTVVADLFYSAVMFGGFALLDRRVWATSYRCGVPATK